MALKDSSPMPFGKYAGKAMIDVPAVYLIWLFDQGVNNPDVKEYILDNLDALKKEAKNVRR